jgi:uncharacterized membrane protein YkoI
MKIRTLALVLTSLASATVCAAAPSAAGAVPAIGETVAQLESRYPGMVVAIAFDAAGDKAPHYHVDMRFAKSGIARLDVDAATLAVSSREIAPLAPGSATLADVTAMLSAAVPGQMLAAEFDGTNGAPSHYDVDVRLPQGSIARLKVDPSTRQIAWRSPAIVND